jgi:hypothetical protein
VSYIEKQISKEFIQQNYIYKNIVNEIEQININFYQILAEKEEKNYLNLRTDIEKIEKSYTLVVFLREFYRPPEYPITPTTEYYRPPEYPITPTTEYYRPPEYPITPTTEYYRPPEYPILPILDFEIKNKQYVNFPPILDQDIAWLSNDITKHGAVSTKVSIWRDKKPENNFSFFNGDFSQGDLIENSTTFQTPGWTIYKEQVKMNGLSIILGTPTPNDATKPAISPGDNTSTSVLFFNAELTNNLPDEYSEPVRSVRMVTLGQIDPYGIAHGPYLVSNTPVTLNENDKVSFQWRAQGGSDAYDVYSYILNISNGEYIELLNATGDAATTGTEWQKVEHTITASQIGQYYFVFISGSYDSTGGTVINASLYVTDVQVIKTPDFFSNTFRVLYQKEYNYVLGGYTDGLMAAAMVVKYASAGAFQVLGTDFWNYRIYFDNRHYCVPRKGNIFPIKWYQRGG